MIKLSFSQNDSSIGGSFWQKDSLITFMIFELCLFMIFSPVANFGHHPLSVRFLGIDKRVCLIGQSMYFFSRVKTLDKGLVNTERKGCVNAFNYNHSQYC